MDGTIEGGGQAISSIKVRRLLPPAVEGVISHIPRNGFDRAVEFGGHATGKDERD